MPSGRQAITWKIATALVVLSLVSVTSCRQVVGIPDPDPPPSCHAPEFKAAASCNGCLLDRCCAELDACQGDLLCRALLECVAVCADDACRAGCETKSKLTETSAALLACQASRCEGECGLSCGGAGAPITSCKPCGASCCAAGTAFRASLDGQLLRACRAACGPADVACAEACANAHAAGADLELTATQCVARSCELGGQWSCVGKSEIRKAKVPTLVLTITAVDVQTLAPLGGIAVKGCSTTDLACEVPPFGTAITDAAGRAAITVTLSSSLGGDAYAGYLEASGSEYLTHLYYFHPAITASYGLMLPMLKASATKQLEALAGVPLAPDRGAVVAQSTDCSRRLAPGMSFRADTADAASRTFYLDNASATGGLPFDFHATATTAVGLGGVFNVPSGPLKLTARVEDLCLETWSANVTVRPGALTVVGAVSQ